MSPSRRRHLPSAALIVAATIGALPAAAAPPQPPVAAQRPGIVRSPHGDREDPYLWLRDDDPVRKRPEVMAWLKAENAYTEAMLKPTAALQKRLVAEMRARIRPDDRGAPVYDNGYWLDWRYPPGSEYPLHVRRRTPDGKEEVVLDVPAMARGHAYYALGGFQISPDNRYVAFVEDVQGRRIHTLRVRDLKTGTLLPDRIPGVLEELAWAADSRTIFYIRQDPVLLQMGPVWRHEIGRPAAEDRLVYDEPDKRYTITLGRTASREFVTLHLESETDDELRIVPAADPSATPRVFIPRRAGHEYAADHLNGRWIVSTNDGAPDFRLVEVDPQAPADAARWRDLVPARDGIALEDFALFDRGIALNERVQGALQVRVIGHDGRERFVSRPDEPAYEMRLERHPEAGVAAVRARVQSMVTPPTLVDIDLQTGDRRTVKRDELPGYDPALYATERLWAPTADGRQRIPVAIAYRKDRVRRDGRAPMLILGYGAYGLSYDPDFDATRLPLLDRGFVVAIAQVRGGADLGRAWYEDGRLLRKKNSFDDFVAATDFLVQQRIADPQRVFALGRSAGGLLMGAIVNQAGEKYRGVLLGVPFVDVVTTMLDETIPLTTTEFTQWGDPRDKAAYDYMLSYSPYDGLKRGPYPALFVTAGLWDSQVQYFEPAKYVAKLRTLKTDPRPLLLHTDLSAGHFGRSGRYDALRDSAREWAFVLDQAGLAAAPKPAR